ncbi:hypothetical protein FLM48_18225 [Shewanella sp. Scap07]|uniref:hypothetical protein n=1 Tax=Shewanella sp. Scap07 TaxID=2589987 RepID=UPI0015BB7489|nr:hypothetical protein [Shewanella sp. Scap07]QLE86836.1 hypothetical protein FLM48_18225 [Shewanella sp. Scap07]
MPSLHISARFDFAKRSNHCHDVMVRSLIKHQLLQIKPQTTKAKCTVSAKPRALSWQRLPIAWTILLLSLLAVYQCQAATELESLPVQDWSISFDNILIGSNTLLGDTPALASSLQGTLYQGWGAKLAYAYQVDDMQLQWGVGAFQWAHNMTLSADQHLRVGTAPYAHIGVDIQSTPYQRLSLRVQHTQLENTAYQQLGLSFKWLF